MVVENDLRHINGVFSNICKENSQISNQSSLRSSLNCSKLSLSIFYTCTNICILCIRIGTSLIRLHRLVWVRKVQFNVTLFGLHFSANIIFWTNGQCSQKECWLIIIKHVNYFIATYLWRCHIFFSVILGSITSDLFLI